MLHWQTRQVPPLRLRLWHLCAAVVGEEAANAPGPGRGSPLSPPLPSFRPRESGGRTRRGSLGPAPSAAPLLRLVPRRAALLPSLQQPRRPQQLQLKLEQSWTPTRLVRTLGGGAATALPVAPTD